MKIEINFWFLSKNLSIFERNKERVGNQKTLTLGAHSLLFFSLTMNTECNTNEINLNGQIFDEITYSRKFLSPRFANASQTFFPSFCLTFFVFSLYYFADVEKLNMLNEKMFQSVFNKLGLNEVQLSVVKLVKESYAPVFRDVVMHLLFQWFKVENAQSFTAGNLNLIDRLITSVSILLSSVHRFSTHPHLLTHF